MHSEVLKLNPMTSMYCAPGDVEACGIKNGMPGWHMSEMTHHSEQWVLILHLQLTLPWYKLYPGFDNIVTITENKGDCYLADSTSCEHLCSNTTNSTNANDHNSVITNTLYI